MTDTGCGIAPDKLENIFREFEQVQSSETKPNSKAGVGLGLAVVSRIVEQLGGQLRVDSTVGKGSQFSFLIPLSLSIGRPSSRNGSSISPASSRASPGLRSRATSLFSGEANIENLVNALSSNHLAAPPPRENMRNNVEEAKVAEGIYHPLPSIHRQSSSQGGTFNIPGSVPVRPVKIDPYEVDVPSSKSPNTSLENHIAHPSPLASQYSHEGANPGKLRVLIVEVIYRRYHDS